MINFTNNDNDMHLMQGDTLHMQTSNGQNFDMKVGSHTQNNSRQWALLGSKSNSGFEKRDYEDDTAPVVLLANSEKDSIRTKETLKQAQSKIKAEYPNVELKSADVAEQAIKNKYKDYPYKKTKTFVQAKPDSNFKVVEGEIIDSNLSKKVGSNHVYFLKAVKDFDVVNKKGIGVKYPVKKGQVSGPMVLSNNKNRQQAQLKALQNIFQKDTGELKHTQNMWLDKNSYLKGNWHLPANSLLINTQVDCKEAGKARDGVMITNSWLANSKLKTNGRTVLIENSGAHDAKISAYAKDGNGMIVVQNSQLSGINTKKPQRQLISDSYLENTEISQNVTVNDSELSNKTDSNHPSVLQNANLNKIRYNKDTPLTIKERSVQNKDYSKTFDDELEL